MIDEEVGRPIANGLPCGFRKRITMDAMGMPAGRPHGRANTAEICEENIVGTMKGRALPAPGGNEGVGEHVRTRSHRPNVAGEIADSSSPHRTKKTCFFCRTGFDQRRAPFQSSIQPFDLMSRRHPLFVARSFLGSSWVRPAPLQMTCRQQSRRHSDQGELTSSSRPCGSSSQSSSLRSSPS